MLDKLDQQKWPAMTIQLAILTITTGLILKEIINSYILLSFALIICTFALQLTSIRFLWLYPVWTVDRRPTERIDTYFLKFYLLFSSIFLSVGLFHWFLIEKTKFKLSGHLSFILGALNGIDHFLMEATIYILISMGFLVPLIFLLWCNKKIRKKLTFDQKKWHQALIRQKSKIDERS